VPIPFAMKPDNIHRDDNSPALIAIREAFMNLLIHTDYFDRKGANIKVYDDRIELTNGGALLFNEKLLWGGYISEPRNPLVMKIFRMIEWSEDTGSGILKLVNSWKKAGFVIPEGESDKKNHYFRLCFRFQKAETEQAPNKYPSSTPQVPRRYPAGTPQVDILEFCLQPRSREEIQEFTRLKDRMHVQNEIINPLINDDLLGLLGNKYSPNLKYLTTEKGKAFLQEA